ncbi:MAG TPA: helicase HerA-like domain-containing protein [Dissulfurispiraceae bacterium]|nr:helicase HerA-like domain-containing protein [Dissulfurispiraceae bacterium]
MTEVADGLLLARTEGKADIVLLPNMANRHGLIAGATGTGKTVSLRVLAEQFSSIGVPVFMADVKGDLSGIAQAGGDHPKVAERVKLLGLDPFSYQGFPVVFWDVFGEQGYPVRTTVSEIGPLLFSRILNLNEVQSGVLTIIYKIADDNGYLLLDLKDLRSMVQFAGDNAAEFKTNYGNISTASIGAIQRNILALEQQGGDKFFGEPALDLNDFMQTDGNGLGTINILNACKLMQSPKVYAMFLLWMLSELFENLPEVGDPKKPKLVFFFDEAHLLFDDIADVLRDKIEQVVRLIRSKGIGVYFVTQNPLDIPDIILGQLGNRVQHALRAFSPRDQKAVKAAADTFRQNKSLNTEKVISELAVGEALVSLLDAKGSPSIVERAYVCPPHSRMAPLTDAERVAVIRSSPLAGHYEKAVDRESAYEKLKARHDTGEAPAEKKEGKSEAGVLIGALAKSAAHAIGSQIGRQIIRGVLGSIFGGRR